MSTKDMLEKHRLLALKTLDNSLFNLLERALSEIRCFELSKGGNYKASEEEVLTKPPRRRYWVFSLRGHLQRFHSFVFDDEVWND